MRITQKLHGKSPKNAQAAYSTATATGSHGHYKKIYSKTNMPEKEYLALGWKVATDSIKNAARGNQNIGALNDYFIETRKRLYALGVTAEELKTYE